MNQTKGTNRKLKSLLIAIVLLQLLLVGLFYNNVRLLNRERDLRNARAHIQIELVISHVKSGTLTSGQLDQIRALWLESGYEEVIPFDQLQNQK